MGGQAGQLLTQIWVGQLTLTRGADCALMSVRLWNLKDGGS